MPASTSSLPELNERDLRARRRRARLMLNDVSRVVALERLVASVKPAEAPYARIVVGNPSVGEARRIGLLAGSFNPLTNAHVVAAEAARRAHGLDLVLWSLAVVTVDKERVMRASVPDRLAQMVAFTSSAKGNGVVVLNCGLYVDQASAVRALLAPGARLAVLVGFDKVLQIFDPRYYTDRDRALESLFSLSRLTVFPRDDSVERDLEELLDKPENRRFADYVTYVDLPPDYAHDSSTAVRAHAARGPAGARRLQSLVPPEGAALACTGAYTPPSEEDAYTWRQRWIHAALALPAEITSRLPSLSALVSHVLQPGTQGQRLRTLLTHYTQPGVNARSEELGRQLVAMI